MKMKVVSGLMLIIGIVLLGAACPQNSNNVGLSLVIMSEPPAVAGGLS